MIGKQTTLDLNGPILSFIRQPVGVSISNNGTTTLVGIATATFPTQTPTNPATNTGSISYKWYEIGFGQLSDGVNITGSATTSLTISNLTTPRDNQRKFYLEADYVASAYGLTGVAVTVGSARSTGNAINEPINSNTANVTVLPLIEIISQPSSRQAIINNNATLTVGANLTDSFFTSRLSYQWFVNGVARNDGDFLIQTVVEQVNQTYSSDASITIPADAQNIIVTVAGASGGKGGDDQAGPGGAGGNGRVGTFSLPNGARTLTFRIGRRGNGGSSGNLSAFGLGGSSNVSAGARGGGAGPNGYSGGGGGGGGATGVFDSFINSFIIVAGAGGGGGGGSLNMGGSSGGTAGGFSSSSGAFSISGGNQGQDKSGDGGGGGGGGGGATGGTGGAAGQDNLTGGGGGSGAGSRFNSNTSTLQTQSENNSDGYVNIQFTTQTSIPGVTVEKTSRVTVSGTKTPTLSIRSDSVLTSTVRCSISNIEATNSPVSSNNVNFISISSADQFNINVEAIGVTNSATISSINLFNGEYAFVTTNSDVNSGRINNFYSFYAPDKDINVEMDLYGAKGNDNGTYLGGEGGVSRIRFTMIRNTEYVITGLSPITKSPFVYRKGSLIATVGAGGNAGTLGKGGFGGGIGVAGESGFGRNAGLGGEAISTGNLPANGIFGSATNLTAISPDNKAVVPNGGRSIPCTRGVYWRQQGVSPCSDVGNTQFRLSDGTIVTNTASITRGFKAGYGINETAGLESSNGGRGGSGATGGFGGTNGSGGGGGSGYTDGSITVVSTQLGGSTENAKVVLRLLSPLIVGASGLSPGLTGKFFNGTWRPTIGTGNIGTLPLTTTNDSSNVTGTTGLPSANHRYGVNIWNFIEYNSLGDSYGFIAIGYFTPPATGTYTIFTSSDDGSGVWIGDLALPGSTRTAANATLNNGLGNGQGNTERSGTILLNSGVRYPIRIVHEQGFGPNNFTFSWSGPGINKTTDLLTYFSTPTTGNTPTGNYL
jgi:hypothetical protein